MSQGCRRSLPLCIPRHQSRAAAVWRYVVKVRWRGSHRSASGQKMSLESFSVGMFKLSEASQASAPFWKWLSSWHNAQCNATFRFVWDRKSKNNGKCICCWSNSLPAEKDSERFYKNVPAYCGYNVTCMSYHYPVCTNILKITITQNSSMSPFNWARSQHTRMSEMNLLSIFNTVPTEVVSFA